jgi:large subunit ribosomal protein L24
MHVKSGDQVIVISGNDKGSTGEVVQVFRGQNRIVVQGVNIRVKHEKPTQASPQGERVEREFPIHASNVQLLDPATGKGTRKRPSAS